MSEANTLKSASCNHPSALALASIVTDYINTEVSVGRLVGPIPESTAREVQVNPVGLIPKPHQVGKWRLLVDLLYPLGKSINSGLSEELASITYSRVDDVVESIKQRCRLSVEQDGFGKCI